MASEPKPESSVDRKVLYWYDPMYPQQKFDKPGKSPFMDMEMVPQYADSKGDSATVRIDPSLTQNLGVRLATVSRGVFASSLEVVGVLAFNERDVAVIQARTAGFVERVYAHAPGDVIKANAALADILVPEWSAAQEEFLALKRSGDAGLLAAARQRLRLKRHVHRQPRRVGNGPGRERRRGRSRQYQLTHGPRRRSPS